MVNSISQNSTVNYNYDPETTLQNEVSSFFMMAVWSAIEEENPSAWEQVELIIPSVPPEKVSQAFEKIMRHLLPTCYTIPLLERFLAYLPQKDLDFLITNHKDLFEEMNPEVVLNFGMKTQNQQVLTILAETIPAYLQPKLIDYCWNQNVPRPIVVLCKRSKQIRDFVREQLSPKLAQGNLGEKGPLIVKLAHYFTPHQLCMILSYLAVRRDFDLGYSLHESEPALFDKFLMLNLGEAELAFLFELHWKNNHAIDSIQIDELCEKLQRVNPDFVTIFVQAEMEKGEITPYFYTPTLAGAIDFIDLPTTQILFSRLDSFWTDKTTNKNHQTLIVKFLRDAGVNSLMAWKYRYPTAIRDFEWISKGSQFGKDGKVNLSEAEDTIEALNELAPGSVDFDPNSIQEYLSGGTCTAMTMRFLREFREAKEQGLKADAALKEISPHFNTSAPYFRTKQTAYNTIARREFSDDFKKDKIDALLKGENPDLKVSQTSDLIHIKDQGSAAFSTLYNELPEGQYIVRSLNLDVMDNRKEEGYGHTTLLIKDEKQVYYYDPAIGPLKLTHPAQLGMILEWQDGRWTIPSIRLYKVD